MSRNTPSRSNLSELPYWDLWRNQIQVWLRRLPRGHQLGSAEEILHTLAGALWLEEQNQPEDHAGASCALRRVLYHEYEALWRHSPLPLLEHLGSSTPSHHAPLELPPFAQDLANAYLAGQGSEGSLKRAMPYFGSKRKVRCLNTLLVSLLQDGAPLRDLKPRAARLLAAASRDGLTSVHLREASYIRRALRMLEPNHEVRTLQQSLSGMKAPQTEASRAGNQECANGCTEPHATVPDKPTSHRPG